ncbi:MAG TPA: hypothetical protein VMV92_37000 [Streptosporangiaceae bacterium]|nr:hypothetical protein [Streptosporangiaceae bacterium]
MTVSRGRRRARFPESAARAEPAPVPAGEDLEPLAFSLAFPDGPGCPVDFTKAACPRLMRPLLTALRQQSQVGGRIRSRGTAYGYMGALRKLDAFVAARVPSAAEMKLNDLSPDLLDAFEARLTGDVPNPRTGYGFFLSVIALLRHLRDSSPGLLHPAMPARLRFAVVAAHSPRATTDALDAYPPQVAAALRDACRKQVREAVQRITVDGEALLAAGSDPRVGGWSDRANILWEIDQRGVMTTEELASAAGHSADWAKKHGGPALHAMLYPTETDLAAMAILFALDTGLEPESLRGLTVDCRKNPARGYVEVEYLKARRHGQEWNRLRVRDGNATTPGGLLRLVLRLTRRARRHASEQDRTALWVSYQRTPAGIRRSHLSHQRHSGIATLIRRHGITDLEGRPLVIDLRRLRKTYKAEFYRATGGKLPLLARGHSKQVAAAHYADIPALRHVHEGAVADGLSEALDEALQLKILSPSDEELLASDPEQAQDLAGIAPGKAGPLLSGELDLWLSACRDFTASPHAAPGTPCPVPFWSCLDCPNAIITSRKLPAILAFLDHVESQREAMSADAWAQMHARTRNRILTQILPAFPPDIITEARAIAEADDPLCNLPPLLGGIGARA